MASYLASERIHALYSSPLRRAIETAAPLAARLGLEPIVEPDVAEHDRTSSTYIPIEELKASGDPRYEEFSRGMLDGMEPTDEFAERVTSSIERIVQRHPGEKVAITCHGGVINVYLSVVLGLAFEAPGFFYPNYTSIHRIAASSSGVRSVITINETSHLRQTGLPMGLFQKG